MRSFYSKASGSGKSRVEWNASIREAGTYELFIKHVPNSGSPLSFVNDPSVEYSFFHDGVEDKSFFIPPEEAKREYDFTVKLRRSNGGEEEIKLNYGTEERGSDFFNGWVASGKYELSPGNAKLVLQDKGLLPGKVLTADAVKWVKID